MSFRRAQLSFADFSKASSKTQAFIPRTRHGSDLRKGLRKLARPIDTKKALHLTFRSEKARGRWSLLKPENRYRIEKFIETLAERNPGW
jgi:hypothetical protein